MSILTNAKERVRFMRFAVVGAIGAVVDFGTFNLLTSFTPINKVVASVISFIAAVISNFIWNRFWTYPDSRSQPIVSQLVQFFLINVIGLGIRTPLFAFSEKFLNNLFETTALLERLPKEFLANNIALAFAVGVVMLWNFFANRYWTYSDVDSE